MIVLRGSLNYIDGRISCSCALRGCGSGTGRLGGVGVAWCGASLCVKNVEIYADRFSIVKLYNISSAPARNAAANVSTIVLLIIPPVCACLQKLCGQRLFGAVVPPSFAARPKCLPFSGKYCILCAFRTETCVEGCAPTAKGESRGILPSFLPCNKEGVFYANHGSALQEVP